MSNCTMGLFWETIVDPITSEKSNRFLQNNLIVQFNITVGGGRGAGTRKIRGREGYGRREKKGREAGSGKREAGSGREFQKGKLSIFVTAYHPVKETNLTTFFDFHLTFSGAESKILHARKVKKRKFVLGIKKKTRHYFR